VRTIIRAGVLVALSAVAVALPGGVRADTPVLTATVGRATAPDSFVISLVDATGTRVTHLDPGPYTIAVHDFATIHNFHLTGPGVNQLTDVEGTETATWNVVFQNGKYHFQCDPHFTSLRGDFTVGTVATTPKLKAQVGPGRTISLKTSAGARVTTLFAGTYVVTVKDAAKADNFHLTGAGVNKKTGVAFRGSASWKLTFKAGQKYRFRSDSHSSLQGSFTAKAKPQPASTPSYPQKPGG
jgi:hypothetical protein